MACFLQYFNSLINLDYFKEAVIEPWGITSGVGYLRRLQWLTGYLRLALVWCGMVHSERGLISVFKDFSASIGKAVILAGGWALGSHSMGFTHFPDIS